MSFVKESENLPDPLIERINFNGWRINSNPSRQPIPEAHKLKTLMQTLQKQQRVPIKRQLEETDQLEAA